MKPGIQEQKCIKILGSEIIVTGWNFLSNLDRITKDNKGYFEICSYVWSCVPVLVFDKRILGFGKVNDIDQWWVTQVRIQDLVKGGPQVLRPKVADIAKWSCMSEVSNLRLESSSRLRALEAFGFLMSNMHSPTF